jgi:stage II sporulation protein R
MVSWEHNRALAAVVDGDIPQESIRLRILANSDSVSDQALKRQVRDAIVEQMNGWVTGPTSLEEARLLVKERLGELEAVTGDVIKRYGYNYTYQVELGVVPFPAKMYGSKVYPAGDYEAVRVTIGAGNGQNWWCVLFPPLCFVDTARGEAVPQEDAKEQVKEGAAGKKTADGEKDSGRSDKGEKGAKSGKDTSSAGAKEAGKKELIKDSGSGKLLAADAEAQSGDEEPAAKKKVRFYLWDKVRSWFA